MLPQLSEGPTTLVWIDTDEAIIVRWEDRATVERLFSGVEGRHRSGGGLCGPDPEHLERARREHLRRFLEEVAEHVPEAGDVTVVGPGLVRQRLESELRAEDRRHHRARHVRSASSDRQTEQELVARVRALAGDAPERRGMPD